MNEGGVAFVGIGEANKDSDDRVKAAVQEALTSPLLGEVDLRQAKGVLIRVVGGPDMTVGEAQKAVEIVNKVVSEGPDHMGMFHRAGTHWNDQGPVDRHRGKEPVHAERTRHGDEYPICTERGFTERI